MQRPGLPPQPPAPPKILQIYRDILKPGVEAGYAAVERDLARACREMGFPHDYLAIESLTGPKEVWFFNGWETDAEQQEVADAYARNAALVAALEAGGKRKASLVLRAIEVFANYRPDLSRGEPWSPGIGRFMTVVIGRKAPGGAGMDGTVFESGDGIRFLFAPTDTREEAQALVAGAGPGARTFAVRPEWSKPSGVWVGLDPHFWSEPARSAGGQALR